jgi:hypothetical protein
MCSMGYKCGDLEVHGSTLMLFCSRYSIVTRAVCGLRCSVGITPSVGQLRAWGEVCEFRVCTLQSLNCSGHALGLFCGHLR